MIAATFFILGLFGLVISRVPRSELGRYVATFRARHGVGVQLSLTVLATVVFSMLVATLTRPGHGLAEQVNAAVVTLLVLAALADFHAFRRRYL